MISKTNKANFNIPVTNSDYKIWDFYKHVLPDESNQIV